MLNNLHQLLSPRKWGIPLAGLGLLLGLGLISKQNQVTSFTDSRFSSAQIHKTSENSLLSQLRKVREQRSQLNAASGGGNTAPIITALVPGDGGTTKSARVLPKANFPVKDGIYLYGQSPKPNQLGQGYIIFQKQQDKVRGALYMPESELNCFQGTINPSGELAMTVNTSSNEANSEQSNQVATSNRLPQVSDDESNSYAYSLALQDFYRLNSIAASDRRTLQMCK
ncbi:hypothetical protein [Nostoc sp. 'Lobaria pulmonaria (5183) cyanobiont']|uniref:hypothetical protein n=1 Tax=Nostoc sp. 'Lobaria pulmonaria (5183) cyanobiont' TaxID=1618022 RepID=UPI000CF32B66|nr:hypothetical protein [Nostoc sp. 'Lobaria pulmonaria (5183) cyanobiont']AVH73191.1 hypothetical protein NLP_4811 [Nostoc sp. 'Lobaria pulmonaria (5183) cyanobiont']